MKRTSLWAINDRLVIVVRSIVHRRNGMLFVSVVVARRIPQRPKGRKVVRRRGKP